MSKKSKVDHGKMTKRQWTWHMMKRYKIGYIMIAPFMLLFFFFTIIPVIASLLVGFTDYNMLEMPNWVWFDNYITLFLDDELFITALQNTMIFAVLVGPPAVRTQSSATSLQVTPTVL